MIDQPEVDTGLITSPAILLYLTDHQNPSLLFFQTLIGLLAALSATNCPSPELSRAMDVSWSKNESACSNACGSILEGGRTRKSDVEIVVMQRAAYAAEAGMVAGQATAMAGASENDVAAAISSAMFRAGGEFSAVMPYVASGPRTMIGHSTWEGRTIQPGEHVFLEVGGCFRRYHAAMMRTVVNGELSESMHSAQELMKHALAELRSLMRPGVTVSEVDELTRSIIESNDVGATLVTRAGYSIGIAFPPSWDEGYILSLMEGDPRPLEPGMTFHLIPWMWVVDGNKTVGISDTVRITEDGCQSFFTLDEDFTVHGSTSLRPLPEPFTASQGTFVPGAATTDATS